MRLLLLVVGQLLALVLLLLLLLLQVVGRGAVSGKLVVVLRRVALARIVVGRVVLAGGQMLPASLVIVKPRGSGRYELGGRGCGVDLARAGSGIQMGPVWLGFQVLLLLLLLLGGGGGAVLARHRLLVLLMVLMLVLLVLVHGGRSSGRTEWQ